MRLFSGRLHQSISFEGSSPKPTSPETPICAWQIACKSKVLRRKPVKVVIGGQPIVLFRDASGTAAALEDRCAHRNAPLSLGRVCNGRLQCAYHGWEYDAEEQPGMYSARLVKLVATITPSILDNKYGRLL